MPKARTVTIKTSQWLRGPVAQVISSCLWNKEYNVGCCLGHIARKLDDCSIKELNQVDMPGSLKGYRNPLLVTRTAFNGLLNTDLSDKASAINDSNISDNRKMTRLTNLFAKHGINLKFVVDEPLRSTTKRIDKLENDPEGWDKVYK